jgi:hypothetical protein
MTARPRPPRPAHPSTSHRHRQTWLTEHQSGAFGRPRLGHPCKLLWLNRLAITMHNVSHMEWGFYSEKPATGGGGGSTAPGDGDGDALAPSDFFSPTGPLRTCPTLVAWPTVRVAACVHTVPLGANRRVSVGVHVERAPG